MGTIKQNEKRGKYVEQLVQERVGGVLVESRIKPYDIETKKEFIEVKSAKLRTIGHKRNQYMQTGRLVINLGSHESLLNISKEKSKIALYIFVVYTLQDNLPKIIKIKTLCWVEVQELLESRKMIIRQNKLKYVCFPHTVIFHD